LKHYDPLRHYETVIIFRPNLSESELREEVETIRTFIESSGNTIAKTEMWGRRRLAYPIEGFSEGTYAFFLFSGEPSFITELDRRYRINEDIIRFLTIKCEAPVEGAPTFTLEDSGDDRRGEERKPKHFKRTRTEDEEREAAARAQRDDADDDDDSDDDDDDDSDDDDDADDDDSDVDGDDE